MPSYRPPCHFPPEGTPGLPCASRRRLLHMGAASGLGLVLPGAFAAGPQPAGGWPVRRADIQVNGQSFHVLEQGEGPAVMFCHGFPDTADTWRSQMAAVAQAGFRAIAPDMRGYGNSYAPEDPALYSAPHVSGDLVGILDARGIDHAVLVGHDWGADHVQRAALLRPDRFRALVSISIPYAPRGERNTWDDLRAKGLAGRYYAFDMMQPDAERRIAPPATTIPGVLYWASASAPAATRWDPLDPKRSLLRPAPGPESGQLIGWADPAYVRHTVAAFERTGFRGGLNYYRALPLTFDLMPAFKNMPLRQPSLYIWGAADGLCQFLHPGGPKLADMRKTQPGLVDAIRFDNVVHWVQHEAAARLNTELVRFLRALPAA